MANLDITHVHFLRGPNIWANFPVMEAWVDLGDLNDTSSEEVPGFNERLMAWLPSLVEHRCSVGERGGFFQRLERGTYPAHILEHLTLELQNLAGHPFGFGKARAAATDRLYKVVVRYLDETVAEACLRTARELLLAAYQNGPFDTDSAIHHLRDLASHCALGPSSMAIVDAARQRGIPWRQLVPGRSLVVLGHGINQHRIWTAETDRSGAIPEYIAQDKELTRTLLKQAGIPVPAGYKAEDADDAWDSAEALASPVVVKPIDANHGRGVFINLTTQDQVKNAYHHALEEGSGVVVERYIPGTDHRLLVVGNQLVAASKGYPAVVIGNGTHTIRDLVIPLLLESLQSANRDECPWSKIDPNSWETSIPLDLADQGYALDSIPREGERVMVARFSHWCIDVTDHVHPSIRDHAVTAAKVAGLDICGIDVVCRSISQPLESQGGAIVEINAGPNLLMFLKPAVGSPRPVGESILNMLFPEENDGRIPLLAVTGSRGKTTCIRLLRQLLAHSTSTLSSSSSEGLHIGSRFTPDPTADRIHGARGTLLHPHTTLALCEAGAEQVLSDGLGFDRCSIGIVLNVEENHLGHAETESIDDLVRAKRCIVDVVLPSGTAVLNADDPLVIPMAEHCKGSVLWFSTRPDNPVVSSHRADGGKGAFLDHDNDTVQLADGSGCESPGLLSALAPGIPAPTALAAIAAAWGHGLTPSAIAEALRTGQPATSPA